jgi:hypothetical protein
VPIFGSDDDPEPWRAPEAFYGHQQRWQAERAVEVGDA